MTTQGIADIMYYQLYINKLLAYFSVLDIDSACRMRAAYFCFPGGIIRVNKTRFYPYKRARLLGDFPAVSSGSLQKMTKRVGSRVTGRAADKAMRKLFK